MIIGFTGTSRGTTQRQKDALRQLFVWLKPGLLRHGDCVDADSEAHDIFRSLAGCGNVFIHPPDNNKYRAFCDGDFYTEPLPYLRRNRYIAGCVAGFNTDLLIACPKEFTEQLRSGTWATMRCARKCGTPRIILLP